MRNGVRVRCARERRHFVLGNVRRHQSYFRTVSGFESTPTRNATRPAYFTPSRRRVRCVRTDWCLPSTRGRRDGTSARVAFRASMSSERYSPSPLARRPVYDARVDTNAPDDCHHARTSEARLPPATVAQGSPLAVVGAIRRNALATLPEIRCPRANHGDRVWVSVPYRSGESVKRSRPNGYTGAYVRSSNSNRSGVVSRSGRRFRIGRDSREDTKL